MAVSTSHNQLINLFGILANIISFGVFLSPMPTFWTIWKKKSTEGYKAFPYSVTLFSAMLVLYYGMLKAEIAIPIITINSFGIFIEAFYLVVFLLYAPQNVRVPTIKLILLLNFACWGLIVSVTMRFANGEDAQRLLSKGGVRESVVGSICAIFSVCVFAAPLSAMRMVIRTKSAEFIPFGLSFALTVSAVTWFSYGLLIRDYYIGLPNVVGFLLGISQMILCIIYKDPSKKPQNNNVVINDSDIEQQGISEEETNNNN